VHVVVATDGSRQAVEAAAFLRTLANPSSVERVTVVAVVSPLAAVPFASDDAETSSLEEMSFRRAAEQATQRLADALRGWGPQVATQVRSGSPAVELVKAAKSLGAGLLVVAHRSSTFESLLLGSVAHRVMNDAPCPVLVVRPTKR
jgi:nucleotide-binding universal stress UspA family protein